MPRNIYDDDHEAFRGSVREFVERTLKPRAEEMIREHVIPRDIWVEAGKQGFFGLGIPEEFGGAGDVAHIHANMIDHSPRSTNCRFSDEMAAAGLSPFGQALVQLRMVWQR